MMDEIVGQMLACEARYWAAQRKLHGYAWWNAAKDRIRKKRGEEGLQVLLDELNGKTKNGKPK